MQTKKSSLFHSFSNILHTFTTRDGGVSKKPYDSLNLAWHVGDDAQHVQINHELLSKELVYDKNSLIHMKQIHSNFVHVVNEDDDFFTPKSCDALITNKKNRPLMVMVADCSPILFYDNMQEVIAVAHAGRAGAFSNIVKNVIDCFVREFACTPENILVTIGAYIGVCCYEVGDEIYEEACANGLEYAMQQKNGRWFLNVGTILESQLLACGVKKEHLEISNECTCCKNETYFSYRADGVTGRFAGVLMIKNEFKSKKQ